MRVEIPNGRTPPDWVYLYNHWSLVTSFYTNNGTTHLLNTGNVSCDVLNRHRVFYGQTMTLTFYPRLVNEYTPVRGKTWIMLTVARSYTMNTSGTPANARQTWSSSIATLRTVRGSCNWRTDFFSTPRTTTSLPRTPT